MTARRLLLVVATIAWSSSVMLALARQAPPALAVERQQDVATLDGVGSGLKVHRLQRALVVLGGRLPGELGHRPAEQDGNEGDCGGDPVAALVKARADFPCGKRARAHTRRGYIT